MKYNTLFRLLTIREEIGPANKVILRILVDPNGKTTEKDKQDLISRMVSNTHLITNMSDLNNAWKLISYIKNTDFNLDNDINFDKMNISEIISDFTLYDEDYNEIQYEVEK